MRDSIPPSDEIALMATRLPELLPSDPDPIDLAKLLAAIPVWDIDRDKPNRELALELADFIGPDLSQKLYRFAVLVTKLA